MDQQNQEIITADSSSTPPKRKRGRPRKYDNVSSDSGSPCSPRGSPPSIMRLQNAVSQSYLAATGQGIQATPTQANLAAYSSLRPQSLPVQTNPSSSPIYGVQSDPAPAPQTASSAHSAIIPAQVNPSGIPSQGPSALLGQAVSGTLDGTFDAGYLLTVRVPDTGLVLKGVVFDPQRSVPISRENDIAPLLPMATSNVVSPSVLEQPSQTLVSVPIHPLSMVPAAAVPLQMKEPAVVVPLQMKEPAASSQTGRQLFATSGLPQNATHLSKNEIAPKVTEIGPKSSINNANQGSPSGAPQREVIKDSQYVDSPAVAVVNKESSQTTLNLPTESQSTNVAEPAGGGQNTCQVEETLANVVEVSGKDAEMHETETSVGDMLEVPRGDVGQVESVGGEQSTHQVQESPTNVIETSAKDAEVQETEASAGDNMVEIPGGVEGKIESVGGEESVHQVEESPVKQKMDQTETSIGDNMVEVPGGDEARIESVGGERSEHQVKESLVNIADATGENAEMQQMGTPAGNMVEMPGGDERHHCPQEPLQSNSPKPCDRMSDNGQLCGERRLEDGETKQQDSTNILGEN